MADSDDFLTRRGRDERSSRLVGEFADDAQFRDYLRDRWLGDEPAPGWSEPTDPGHSPAAPPPPETEPGAEPPAPPRRRLRWRVLKWTARASLGVLLLLVAWLALLVPVSRTAEPLVPPPVILTASDGSPIARMGPVMDRPIDMDELPPYVAEAFLAIEDRRFYSHWGIDPRGIARAMWNNLTSDSREGGSTITQQLAKLTYLSSDQTIARKAQEVPIAFWLELWLTKDEILERYLSNAYFGDNVYGLRAASLHYFYRHPENLTLSQATMLAGLVRAPSRLAPTQNLEAAQARQRVVIQAMVEARYLTEDEADAIRPAAVDHRPPPPMPRGGYFADWAIDQARSGLEPGYETVEVETTLDSRLQRLAESATRNGAPRGAQVALVAMRPNGEVVAMVGGRNYRDSAFNRVTQALRQPGSTFKLVVYLAALRSGMEPDTLVDDSPIEEGDYRPANYGERYRGEITLREAFARSSNVVAVRLYQELGADAIADAARSLGIERPLPANASVALGTADLTLLELTSAYATIANEGRPVMPRATEQGEPGLLDRWFGAGRTVSRYEREALRELLAAAINEGTGTAARLSIPAFGKTGTTQDSRDALFVGFTDDLVVGVWIGNDDNSPLGSASGGGAPARIWRTFMSGATPGAAPRQRASEPEPEDVAPTEEEDPAVKLNPDGSIVVDTGIGGGRIAVDENGVVIEPDAQTRRRLDELEQAGEDIGRAAEEAVRQNE